MAVQLSLWMKALLGACVFGVPMSVGYFIGTHQEQPLPGFFVGLSESLQQDLQSQRDQLNDIEQQSQRNVRALGVQMAELQSRLVRLEALGSRVAERAELDTDEFDFTAAPALGGPVAINDAAEAFSGDLALQLSSLETQLADREMQLGMLSSLMLDRDWRDASSPSGMPAASGWLSSRYGMRTDPFTGEQAWHNGIDIAGREGTPVLAVASGVVSYAAENAGYGNMIEVTHDNGLVTLYAHNKELLVEQGTIVHKGQQIATMGNTGRSTGPHIHFEVYKNGRSVDPASYIQRTIR